MPAINAGRANVNQAGKSTGKRRVKRVRAKVAGPPAPKKPVAVAPADRVQERATKRNAQLKVSVKKAGDAPQNRAADQQKAQASVKKQYADAGRMRFYKPGTTVPPKIAVKHAMDIRSGKLTKSQTAALPPVLKVLDQTTRPIHAVAGAADAVVTGKNVPKAALRGVQNKDKTTFSTVLKHLGVKNKTARSTAGFVLDVGLDPTTYLTLGAAPVARKVVMKEGEKAAKKALAKGLTEEQAKRFGERAAKQAEKTADQTKGVTVKVGGKEIPGVRKATATASKPVRAAARKTVPQRVRDNSRAVLADVNPDVAPAGVAKGTSRKAVQATRTARAKSDRGLHEAQQHALGIKQQVGEANYSRVIDAIEAGKIGSLPPELRDVAVRVRSQFRHANRQRKQAGIAGGEIKKRARVKVPTVTADTSTTAKALAAAHRAEATAHKNLETAKAAHDVHQGRAEVLSRNVGGSASEKAAERGRRKRKTKTAPVYAGGGQGVKQTAQDLQAATAGVQAATTAREAAHATHEAEKTSSAAQRTARDTAEKTNAKRAAAPKEYIPHQLTEEAAAEGEKRAGGVGRRVIRPSSSKARSDNRPLAALRTEHPGKYSEDLPNLYANRKAEGATAVARAELNRRIAALGRDVKKGQDVNLGKGESVYHVVGSDIRKVTEKEAAQVADKGGKKGRYVVLHDDIVKRAIEGSQPTLQGPGIIRGTDKITAGFKRIALATPGFHVRNLVGDSQNAYLGQGGHRLPRNMVDAGRVLKAEGRRDKSLRTLAPGKAGAKTLKTKRYGNVSYDEVAAQLSKHGAMRSGYTARELPELAGKTTTLGRVRAPRRLKQALLNREDLPRLTTALDALKRGATWEEAAQRVADYHFDYGHLTNFERNVARRVAPFYTFSARNIPLQTKSLITKPGKFANYEKLREEAAKAAGMDEENQKARHLTDQLKKAGVKIPDGWEANLSEWEARNAGVPVSWKGHKFTVSMGMPLVDLNELPGASLNDQFNEYYQKGMSLAGPIPKNAIEYMENHSFFFRDQIERDNAPLVAAPAWVKALPLGLRKKMGVTENWIDKKTGKKALAYNAKADYVVKSIPGTPQFLNKIATDGHDRVGKGPLGKTLSFVGVKATPYDPVANSVNLAYDRLEEIGREKAVLNQQGINAKNPTKKYQKLQVQEALLNSIAYQGRQKQGYKVLPTVGGPKKYKVRGGSGFDFKGGSGGFDFSGGSGDFDFG